MPYAEGIVKMLWLLGLRTVGRITLAGLPITYLTHPHPVNIVNSTIIKTLSQYLSNTYNINLTYSTLTHPHI